MKITEKNYRLVVLGCCFAIFVTLSGMVNSTGSLFIVPVSEAFGFSRSSFSLTLSLSTVSGIFINLFYGKLQKRLGVRLMVALGFASAIVAYILLWQAKTLALFYLGGLLAGLGLGFNSTTTIALIINNWFKRRKGTLLGCVSAGSGLGGFLFNSIFGAVIASHGYQAAYLLTVIVLICVAIPVVALLREHPPESAAETKDTPDLDEEYFTGFKRMLHQPKIWRTFLAAFLIGASVHAVLVAIPGQLQLQGFGAAQASTIYGGVFLVMGITKIFMGWLNDRCGIRLTTILSISCFLIGATMLIFTSTPAVAWVFVVIFGLALPSEAVLVPLIARNVMTKRQYGEYLGIYIASLIAGLTAGVPVINFFYDAFGSYTPALLFNVALGILSLWLLLPVLDDKKNKLDKTEGPAITQAPIYK
ncbi:MAG: MFS transporter [Clostridia bacterium]|nr:MFS transporter [Clostridia bacterium]